MAKHDEKIDKTISNSVDYVLAVRGENVDFLNFYMNNLKLLGFKIDIEPGQTVELTFIKLTISEDALRHFSEVYDIGNEKDAKLTAVHVEQIYPNPFHTPLSKSLPKLPGEITPAEKIMIINQLLESAKYGENIRAFGLSKLIRNRLVETAYPLHDGPASWTGENTRSLLLRYWSNTGLLHKEQPLDLVQKYFGHEIAFYFAWLEYFNLMLIVPSVLGGLVFLASLMWVALGDPIEIKELCLNKDKMMCPTCEGKDNCKFKPISRHCALAQWTFVFDNYFTIAFAVFMSFWATAFLIIWRRKENKLKMRWNTNIEEYDTEIRQAYADSATHKRKNRITGEIEPYTPRIKQFFHYMVTFTICGVMILIMCLTILFNVFVQIMIVRLSDSSHNKYLMSNSKLLTLCFGSMCQVFYIKMFGLIYGPLSVKLTHYENPRTQLDFDNSVLYKRYLLSFTNNYIPLFYLAFIKGKLYTLPHKADFISKDVCQPCNCISSLCIQLTFLLTCKSLAGNLAAILFPQIKKFFTKKSIRLEQERRAQENRIPQWEEDYFLTPTNRYLLTTEFTEMIIKYGFVTFFVAAFPLAPLCALINNMIEARSDAYKMVTIFRRPIPLRKAGIGAWNGVLLSVTYFSAATNAFVIAFTTDFVPRQIYLSSHGNSLKGFFNFTLSEYATKDFPAYDKIKNHVDYCYFRGYYHPPGDPQQYQLDEHYWKDLTIRFIVVFVFEHFILISNTVMSYSIPKIPVVVKEQLDLDQQELKSEKMAIFENSVNLNSKEQKEKIKSSIKLSRE